MPDKVLRLRGKTRAKRLESHSRECRSMFLKRGRKVEFVRSGSLFQRINPDASVETARIIGVRTDTLGIAHVRYDVMIAKRHIPTSYREGPRTLSLATFTETYRDRRYSADL